MASTYRPVQAGARHRIDGTAVNAMTGEIEPLTGRTVFGVIVQNELEVQVEGDVGTGGGATGEFFFDLLPAVTIPLVVTVTLVYVPAPTPDAGSRFASWTLRDDPPASSVVSETSTTWTR